VARSGVFCRIRGTGRRGIRLKFFCGRFRHSSWQSGRGRRGRDERH
jgi:hypothetical protein